MRGMLSGPLPALMVGLWRRHSAHHRRAGPASSAFATHERAVHEHQKSAKEHHRAAKLHAMGWHRMAVEKSGEAASTSQRAASSGAEAVSEAAQATRQNTLDSGRLYLGDRSRDWHLPTGHFMSTVISL